MATVKCTWFNITLNVLAIFLLSFKWNWKKEMEKKRQKTVYNRKGLSCECTLSSSYLHMYGARRSCFFCMDTMKIADALLPHGIHSVAVCVCVCLFKICKVAYLTCQHSCPWQRPYHFEYSLKMSMSLFCTGSIRIEMNEFCGDNFMVLTICWLICIRIKRTSQFV